MRKRFDLLFVVGSRHTGAYAIYGFGRVARLDMHHDMYGLRTRSTGVNCGNYLLRVLSGAEPLASREDVTHYGAHWTLKYQLRHTQLEERYPALVEDVKRASGEVFDVDLDAFGERHGLPVYDTTGDANPAHLNTALQSSGPSIVGVFEFWPERDVCGKGAEFLKKVARAAVLGRLNRLNR